MSNGRIPTLLAVILLLAACGGGKQASGDQAAGEPGNKRDVETEAQATARSTTGNGGGAVARAGEAVARAGGNARARAGDAVAKAGNPGGQGSVREVSLEIGGDPETEFSGTCIVGDEKREISGQVPERFVYEPDGRKLECEIHKRGRDTGAMKIVLTAGNINHVQRTESRSAIVRITYSAERGFSSSIQASSGSASQTQIISNSTSVESSSSTSSR